MAAASIALALGLVGCGEKQQETQVADTQAATAPAEKPLELGIELANMDSSVRPQDDFYYLSLIHI